MGAEALKDGCGFAPVLRRAHSPARPDCGKNRPVSLRMTLSGALTIPLQRVPRAHGGGTTCG